MWMDMEGPTGSIVATFCTEEAFLPPKFRFSLRLGPPFMENRSIICEVMIPAHSSRCPIERPPATVPNPNPTPDARGGVQVESRRGGCEGIFQRGAIRYGGDFSHGRSLGRRFPRGRWQYDGESHGHDMLIGLGLFRGSHRLAAGCRSACLLPRTEACGDCYAMFSYHISIFFSRMIASRLSRFWPCLVASFCACPSVASRSFLSYPRVRVRVRFGAVCIVPPPAHGSPPLPAGGTINICNGYEPSPLRCHLVVQCIGRSSPHKHSRARRIHCITYHLMASHRRHTGGSTDVVCRLHGLGWAGILGSGHWQR